MFLSMGLDGRFKVALRKESVDRNTFINYTIDNDSRSLSARRAWIEITSGSVAVPVQLAVALRKESVDRNTENAVLFLMTSVALRKESVDRNCPPILKTDTSGVALRKESVDRNRSPQATSAG